jgi:hypothetical protein
MAATYVEGEHMLADQGTATTMLSVAAHIRQA